MRPALNRLLERQNDGKLDGMQAARTIVSINHKGGTGKTHLAYLIAAVCQSRGKRCLLVDLDPQGNLTSSFLPDHREPTGAELLFDPSREPTASEVIHRTKYSRIDLIPATPLLGPLDLSHESEWEASDLQLSLVTPLAELAERYDYIVLDCPPRLSLTSFAALCAGQYVLIPLEAADWGARGTQAVVGAMDLVKKRYNPRLQLLGYVVSRYKGSRSYQQEYLKALRRAFAADALWTLIPDLAEFEKAVTDRQLVSISYPDSHAASIANSFFDEVEARIERGQGVGQPSRRSRIRRRSAVAV